LNVREDALLLYGFYTHEEYEIFLQLLTVTGIGPKVGLGVLSAISPGEFRMAVSQKNSAVLTRISGIGKKTAERIILELKDKIGIMAVASGDVQETLDRVSMADNNNQQAMQALIALGYSQGDIMPVLKKVADGKQSVEALIKLALKEISHI
jgi:holliday junction DNA helicase RuvA